MRDTAENLLDTLNSDYCFLSAISDQHNSSVTKNSSNFYKYYSEYLYLFPNQAGLIDVDNTRIIDTS